MEGKQQEGAGLEPRGPHPDSRVVPRTGPKPQIGRANWSWGDTTVTPGLRAEQLRSGWGGAGDGMGEGSGRKDVQR